MTTVQQSAVSVVRLDTEISILLIPNVSVLESILTSEHPYLHLSEVIWGKHVFFGRTSTSASNPSYGCSVSMDWNAPLPHSHAHVSSEMHCDNGFNPKKIVFIDCLFFRFLLPLRILSNSRIRQRKPLSNRSCYLKYFLFSFF